MADKTRIGLLFGGRSAEHEVSISSAAAVFNHFPPQFEVFSIYIDPHGLWAVVDRPDPSLLDASGIDFFPFLPWTPLDSTRLPDIDVYFPLLHGPYGEDGTIQGLFELADVPFVGASVLASAAGMDKAVAKLLFKERGLPVADFLVLHEQDYREDREGFLENIIRTFTCPFFIKPANMGSSVGISKVKAPGHTVAALESAFRYDSKILAEETIVGREIECSVLGNDRPRASLPGEIIPHREFYDYRDKYKLGKTRFGLPADLTPVQTEEIKRLSVEAFRAINACGMARVDFFLPDDSGQPILNEINTIPGFTEISMYPKLWEISGLSFPSLLENLIELALERHRAKKRHTQWE